MLAPKEVVQRRGIGASGIFRNGRIGILFFSVGREGRAVEGDERRAGTQRSRYAFDGRMRGGDKPPFARDEADACISPFSFRL